MKSVKGIALAVITGLLVGCAGSARHDYYVAMQIAAEEKAKVQTARYEALSKMAASGDPGTSAAAVMAIALTEDNTVAPQYVESESLSWARVLANPIATLGLAGIQANVAMNASNNAADVQLASFEANKAIQLGQQSMVTDLGGQWSSAAAASGAAVVELGVAGFNALNTAGSQTVDVATAGFNANENIATTGFGTVDSVATTGFGTVDSVATTGFGTVDSVATTGFDTAQVLGVAGITEVSTVGQAGLTGLVDLGTVSVNGLNTMSADYNGTIDNIITTNAGTVQGLTADYTSLVANINNTINSILNTP